MMKERKEIVKVEVIKEKYLITDEKKYELNKKVKRIRKKKWKIKN